ncbi:MAG TPA: ribosomal L7Ae/L30e/S12e/Gadd45 family protein [Bacillota bacterium]|nr:ribosomal L7Ae/L30e/S12e/Gadd45 family protein [Bacillota bacterium]HPZ41662.1 ribosomal L7Ae/L30e/S12e/Gadd45 family protein [Bacillota bacterium]HQD52284.1 ribosomal L7Ae/L30e/S12e/Gadd45 family protein [Bacillota bacterium]
MSEDELIARVSQAGQKVVGTKQTLKALEKGEAVMVLLAKDAEEKISAPVAALAENKGVKVHYIETMSELGKICGIKVKAAAAAIIEF